MASVLRELLVMLIRENGPITVAVFMEAALYHPEHGYYATEARRSGRGGDCYTSVDAGSLFGETLAGYFARRWIEMARPDAFDLVEAGAGNGRLARDVADAAAREHPDFYETLRLHLVERSAHARDAQRGVLGPHASKLASSAPGLPASVTGAIVANELLDALPCHLVTQTADGLRELYVAEDAARFVLQQGPLSDDAIAEQLARVDARLEAGWRAEVNLLAPRWIEEAASAIRAGELLVFDYGHEARELYSAAHASGTLVSYHRHRVDADWLADPGERDLTAHVDFTAIRQAAEAAGLTRARLVDQTRFLLDAGIAERLPAGSSVEDVRRRLAAKTLIAPEGLGGTMKVLSMVRPA
ncbi:MAG: SAM-dependent methyltransferase [Acidobacteria bacterium]|nr:MAG: SAM-dependent methyltransferase [Acidobacteriota bacterium]